MSVTCGFYDSIGGDRKYKSSQMSRLFDGIIKDGIFMSVGDAFVVMADSGNTVSVGSGLAWFNHTWTYNDAPLLIDCGEPNTLRDRIDAIVIKIGAPDAIRDNTIEYYKGTEASTPSKPKFDNTDGVYYYPLCYIYRTAGSKEITQGNITDARGTETDYVTGILETLDKEQLILQWRAELDEFVASEEQVLDVKYTELQSFMDAIKVESEQWNENQRNTILAWFENIQDLLESNTAIKLEEQIRKANIERMLMCGLANGVKTFSENGQDIETVDPIGYKLYKTFSSDFSYSTTMLYDSGGGLLGILYKNFSSDGSTISSELTIF